MKSIPAQALASFKADAEGFATISPPAQKSEKGLMGTAEQAAEKLERRELCVRARLQSCQMALVLERASAPARRVQRLKPCSFTQLTGTTKVVP